MSISSLGSYQQVGYAQQIQSSQGSGQSQVSGPAQGRRRAGDGDGGGAIFSAISNALQQLGINTDTSVNPTTKVPPNTATTPTNSNSNATKGTSASPSAETPQQALSSFVQTLFAAIQTQVSQQRSAASSGSNTLPTVPTASPITINITINEGGASNSTSGANSATQSGFGSSAVSGYRHHSDGGAGKLESGIQSLINQLSSSSSSSNNGGTGATGSTSSTTSGSSSSGTSSSSNSALSALQSSFNTLLSTDGISSNNATLTGFLQSLANNLQSSSTSGNAVHTKV